MHFDNSGQRTREVTRRDILAIGAKASAMLLTAACGGGMGGGTVRSPSTGESGAASPEAMPTPLPTSTDKSEDGQRAIPLLRFGANCYDLFYLPFLFGLSSRPPLTRLQALRDAGMSFVRFSASGYWPNDFATWERDPGRYLSTLDAVFDAADKVGMQLIPCLLWAPAGVSDYFGERYSAWGNASSRSRAFLESYIPQIVQRYDGRTSINMWEFANEFNSFADLPNGEQFYPTVNVAAGTFASRTADDRISWKAIADTSAACVRLIRDAGSKKRISPGSNIPRYNQINNAKALWAFDSPEQLYQALQATLVGNYDVLSIHLYPELLRNRFESGTTFAEVLKVARRVANEAKAKLLVGEFGIPRSGDTNADKIAFAGLLDDMRTAGVDYAALWNFDYWDSGDKFNVTSANDRAWMLDMVRKANGN